MAEKVAANLSIAAFTRYLAYPITAKYHLSSIENIPVTLLARSRNAAAFSDYDALCVRQMDLCMRQLLRHPDGYLLAPMDVYGERTPQNQTLIF